MISDSGRGKCMIVFGLTGSIGMGKSTTAGIFRRFGVPVHDSDAAVHEFYRGPGAALVESAFPGVVEDGVVNRVSLGRRVFGNPEAIARLEKIVHPVIADDRNAFLSLSRFQGRRFVVLDIPLLFEIGGLQIIDIIVVVSAPAAVQKSRVLAREGMTEDRFEAIRSKQVSDALKRQSAHLVIDTGFGLEHARDQVACLLRAVSGIHGFNIKGDHAGNCS